MAEGAAVVLVWVLVCIGATIAIVELTDGTWQAIGLTAIAFLAAPLVEVPAIFTERGYEEYRQEWTRSHRARLG
jgi:hypothetical protein